MQTETELVWDKQQCDSPLGAVGQIVVEGNEKTYELVMKTSLTPLVGLEPFCGLGDAIFKEELKRMTATKRDRL